MKANAGQIARAVERPSPETRLILLHGPDEAGAAELAATLGQSLGAGAERVDLDGAALRSTPGRLADEAASLSLFGERRWIRVAPAGEECLEAATLLLAAPEAIHPVVMIAPTIRSTGKLAKVALAARAALVFACWVPDGANAERLVATTAHRYGLRLAGGVAGRLAEASGGDRAVLNRELEKLALYLDADESRPAECDDSALDAVGAALDGDDFAPLITATLAGDLNDVAALLARAERLGTSAVPLLRQYARRLIGLIEMRAATDNGHPVEAAMDAHRVARSARPATARMLRRWTPDRLLMALSRVRVAERRIMAAGTAGDVLAHEEVLAVARAAARRG